MNWKEFFKLTIGKMTIFFILLGFTVITTSLWTAPPPKWLQIIEPVINLIRPAPYFLEPLAPFGYFILWIIYWYLLSCIIIWICNKVKKK